MADRIQLRRDTAANWLLFNPTLYLGEVGIETDTQLLKVGNGSTAWDLLPYTVKPFGTTADTVTVGNDSRLSNSRTPTGAAGGDLSGTYPNPAVSKINGITVSSATPSNGQVLQYNSSTSTWVAGSVPSGGSGGGGLIYYFNNSTAADLPLNGLPTSPVTVKELGRVGDVASTTVTSANLSEANFDLVCHFVSDVLDPDVTAIPAGLFDFNFWASSNANSANQTIIQIKVFRYDGANPPTLLASSDDVSLYDPTVTAQYIASVVLPQTSIASTDRLYIQFLGKATANNRTVTFSFGDGRPSHVHTTVPSVGGSGLVKVINGVFQSPASALVNADVDANAAIALTKLNATYTGTGSALVLSASPTITGTLGAAAVSTSGNVSVGGTLSVTGATSLGNVGGTTALTLAGTGAQSLPASASEMSLKSIGSGTLGIASTYGSLTVQIGGSNQTILKVNGQFNVYSTQQKLVSFDGSLGATFVPETADFLSQRNGTTAQGQRVYNTWTSATNYERAKAAWESNVLKIGTEKGSAGGVARGLALQTDNIDRISIGASGNVTIAGITTVTAIAIGLQNVTSSTTCNGSAMVLADAASGNIVLTLPAPLSGQVITIKKINSNANTVTITPPTGTIDGAANKVLTAQYQSATIICDGTNYFIV